jgi:TolB-like protein
MPKGPGVAVLPFVNLSGDANQEYFSDGLTEDIMTKLARVRDLRVLARNTTFQYKGKAVDVSKLGRELGVRYVLEGSVRRAGDDLRIAAYSRYYHAIDVFHSAVYSASPAFVWANETKIACAKAIGYLKLGHFRREIDVENIQKCECFNARMVRYLAHR